MNQVTVTLEMTVTSHYDEKNYSNSFARIPSQRGTRFLQQSTGWGGE